MILGTSHFLHKTLFIKQTIKKLTEMSSDLHIIPLKYSFASNKITIKQKNNNEKLGFSLNLLLLLFQEIYPMEGFSLLFLVAVWSTFAMG